MKILFVVDSRFSGVAREKASKAETLSPQDIKRQMTVSGGVFTEEQYRAWVATRWKVDPDLPLTELAQYVAKDAWTTLEGA